MKILATLPEVNNEKTSSRYHLIPMNCPITNFWNKQTVLRFNFCQTEAAKNSSRVKSKKTPWRKQISTIWTCSSSFWKKCSLNRQKWEPTKVNYRTDPPDTKSCLFLCNVSYKASKVSKPRHCLQEPTSVEYLVADSPVLKRIREVDTIRVQILDIQIKKICEA